MLIDSARQFRKEDFPKLAEFVRKRFHEKYVLSDENFFQWQYRRNPYLDDFAFFLLEQDKKLYGYIGLAPLDYKIGSQTARLNMYANLLVDERARSLGLGTLLIKRAMAAGSPAGICGYTPQSFPIYQKLGHWRALGNFYRYIYIFNQDKVEKLLPEHIALSHISRPLAPDDDGLSFAPITKFDAAFDAFWRNIRNRYVVTAERTSAYLNWRYAAHPYLKYEMRVAKRSQEIIGFIIYRIERVADFAIARIVDFVSAPDAEAEILRAFAAEVAPGVDLIDFMFSGQYYHEALKQLGFFDVYGTAFEHLPMYFNPISYSKNYINFCVWLEHGTLDKNIFYNHNNWYLTRGDGDQDRPNPH